MKKPFLKKNIEFELCDICTFCFKTSGIWLPSEIFNKVRKSEGLQGQHSSKGVLCPPFTQQKPSQVYSSLQPRIFSVTKRIELSTASCISIILSLRKTKGKKKAFLTEEKQTNKSTYYR